MAENQASITTEEWLAELSRLTGGSDEGETVAEIIERSGMGREKVRAALKKAQALGRLWNGWRSAVGIDGRAFRAPVYRILPAPAVTKPRHK